jgi:hypothetical protein
VGFWLAVCGGTVCIFRSPKKIQMPQHTQLYAIFIFKIEEEKPALLLHLPKLVAETVVFGSASGMCCRLVVATPQAPLGNQHSGLLLLCNYLPIPYKKRL